MSGGAEPLAVADASAVRGVQVGDSNIQFNYFGAAAGTGTVVVGDVPQEPAAFQPRTGLAGVLGRESGARVRVVFAVTGIRGVGKTQVAATYARRRIADGWRLVAWVDASYEASVLAGLAQAAVVAGVGSAHEDARVLATGLRHWLEADGERRLLVFDNAVDLDVLRPFLPAAGTAHVVITSSRRSTAGLGMPVAVDVFSEGEALAFLAERTGLDDEAGARELGRELGWLPLGLAQAAAVIAQEHLSFGTYLKRLRVLPVASYMRRVEGDAYRYRLAEAVVLSLRGVEACDPSGLRARLMGLVSVLAETGVSRRLLHLAARTGVLDGGQLEAAEVDAAVGDLSDASLLGFAADDSVVAHRLVARVARERLASEGGLPAVSAGTVRLLAETANGITEAWRDPAGVRELAGHVGAVTAHLAAHTDALAGETLASLLQLRLRSVHKLNELGDSTGLVILAAEPLVEDCERLLGTDHADTLSARVNLAHGYQDVGRIAEAIPLFERTLGNSERLLGTDHPDSLRVRACLAMAYCDTGRTAEGILLLERTLGDCERLLSTDHPHTLTSRSGLAAAYRHAGRIVDAIRLYEQALGDSERLLGTDHPDTWRLRDSLAAAYRDAGRTAEAIRLANKVLGDFERLLGADHPDALKARYNLATAYLAAGQAAEAISLLDRVLGDCERLLGADHPDTLKTRDDLGMAYLAAGQAAEAISLLDRVLGDCERLLAADHRHTLRAQNNLGVAYQGAGRIADAIRLYERALGDSERVQGAEHPGALTVRSNLATAYYAAGRIAEAIPLLECALGDRERVLGIDHLDTLKARNNLAMAYLAAGRPAEAIPLVERALDDFEQVLGTDHPETLTARSNLAMAYHIAGRITEAIPLLQRVLGDFERALGTDHPSTNVVRRNLAALTGEQTRNNCES